MRELRDSLHGAASELLIVKEERGSDVDRGTKRERQKRKSDQKEYVWFGQ